MATRRDAREWGIQILFQLDLNPTEKVDGVFAIFWQDKQPEDGMREFTESLVRGVRSELARIDELIAKHAKNWRLDRMAAVDRNILRMATYEMLFCEDIPPIVSINEAVDVAKYFGSNESGKFVNGILDRLRQEIDRPSR